MSVGVGYPDWVRVQEQAGPLLVDEPSNTVWNATRQFGPFYVGVWRHLRIRWRPSPLVAAVYQINAFFYADAAATKLTAIRTYEFAFDAFLHQIIPIGGSYCLLQFARVSGSNPTSLLKLQPLQVRDSLAEEVDTQIPLKLKSQSVGAGVTATFNGIAVVQGAVTLHINTNASVWTAFVLGLDSGGNTWELVRQASALGPSIIPIPFVMPGITHQLSFTNSDAAARNLTATIVLLGQQGIA